MIKGWITVFARGGHRLKPPTGVVAFVEDSHRQGEMPIGIPEIRRDRSAAVGGNGQSRR